MTPTDSIDSGGSDAAYLDSIPPFSDLGLANPVVGITTSAGEVVLRMDYEDGRLAGGRWGSDIGGLFATYDFTLAMPPLTLNADDGVYIYDYSRFRLNDDGLLAALSVSARDRNGEDIAIEIDASYDGHRLSRVSHTYVKRWTDDPSYVEDGTIVVDLHWSGGRVDSLVYDWLGTEDYMTTRTVEKYTYDYSSNRTNSGVFMHLLSRAQMEFLPPFFFYSGLMGDAPDYLPDAVTNEERYYHCNGATEELVRVDDPIMLDYAIYYEDGKVVNFAEQGGLAVNEWYEYLH